MKLYRLQLRNVPVPAANANFSYAALTREILTAPIPGNPGIGDDSLFGTVALSEKVKEAATKGQAEVYLTPEEHARLLARVKAFHWSFQHPDVAPVALDFVAHIKGLKEEECEVTPRA